jgi:hypothetical protein
MMEVYALDPKDPVDKLPAEERARPGSRIFLASPPPPTLFSRMSSTRST